MEKIKSLILALCISTSALLANDNQWKSVHSELKQVFIPNKTANKIEIIRLYKDNSFEHLLYTPDRIYSKSKEKLNLVHKSKVQRNSGVYTLSSGKINFNCTNKSFPSVVYEKSYAFVDNKIYKNKLQSKTHKNDFLFKTTSEKKYDMPFYLDPISNLVVTNPEAYEKIDLADLVGYLTKSQTSDVDKFQAIRDYLNKDVLYDEDFNLANYQTANEQIVRNILSGRERTVNSKSLANSIEILGGLVGLKIRTIGGFLKKQKGFGYQKVDHSWNELTSVNDHFLCDIALGDSWMKVDPEIMIYSHFPINEADQLLKTPISLAAFESLVYMEPKNSGAKFSSFLPLKNTLNAKNKINLLFDQQLNYVTVEFFNFDPITNTCSEKSTNIVDFKKERLESKTLLTIPITSKSGRLLITSSNGLKISYFITNNGIEEDEVAAFVKNITNKNISNNVMRPIKTGRELSKVDVTKIVSWANSTEPFLNDLALLEVADNAILQMPLIVEARKLYGVKEVVGKVNNPIIVKFFKETGNSKIKTDEDAWCSVFVGYCAKKAGFNYKIKPLAKSWLDLGQKVQEPQPGDLVIFWREDPSSWKGHVSIFIGKDTETNEIICLGGNQDDQVCFRRYSATSVVGYRRLVK